MNPSTMAAAQPPLSRFERLKLSIHRALDKHLSPRGELGRAPCSGLLTPRLDSRPDGT